MKKQSKLISVAARQTSHNYPNVNHDNQVTLDDQPVPQGTEPVASCVVRAGSLEGVAAVVANHECGIE